MSQTPILQQMYIKQGQFLLNTQLSPAIETKTIDRTCLIMSITIGMLLAGIVLSITLTLYLTKQFPTTASVTTAAETTTMTTSTQTQTTTTTAAAEKHPYICSGISSSNLWKNYTGTGIFMDVDTSNCNFTSIPSYFTSISGTSSHWDLAGYGAIYSPTSTTFSIYAKSMSNADIETLLARSITNKWNVHWLGIVE